MPRALTIQEVKQKESYILNKAFKLFENHTFKSFRMDDLAKSANMSKGILFKYFRSKEMLFIKMLEVEYEKLFNSLDKVLIHHNEMTKDEYKELLLIQFEQMLDVNTPIMRLLALKNSVLETNQDYDFAMKNKSKINDLLFELSQNVLLKVNGLSFTQVQEILDIQTIILSGFLNVTIKEGVVKNVVEEGQLNMFMVDYKEVSMTLFQSYLKGL